MPLVLYYLKATKMVNIGVLYIGMTQVFKLCPGVVKYKIISSASALAMKPHLWPLELIFLPSYLWMP